MNVPFYGSQLNGTGENVTVEPITRRDSRDLNQQLDDVLAMLAGGCELAEDEQHRLDYSLRYVLVATAAHSGWGDEYVLKPTKMLVETLNELHAASKGRLISPQVSESLCNFIHNNLVVGEYSGSDDDPTKPWREW